ncbi:Centromere/kinetochore protein zw10 [Actinomortierella wolfii]|nr:Centromere/kinetochore protein zw10 [Actinomortierella wolfii]
MATEVLSTRSFAKHVAARSSISQLQSHQDPSSSPSVESPSLEDLMTTVASLDSEIQAIKAEVHKKLLVHYDAFIDSFEYSAELNDRIRSLLSIAEDMTVQTIDPEHGLRHKVMTALVNHHEVSYKVQENEAIVEGLKHFAKIEDILLRYESCMSAGKILQAGECIQQAMHELENPPNKGVAASTITAVLTEQCTRMTGAIHQLLDDLIANALTINHADKDKDKDKTQKTSDLFELTLAYTIPVPSSSLPPAMTTAAPGEATVAVATAAVAAAAPKSIRWHELLRSLVILNAYPEKLRPLQKAVINHLIGPLVRDDQHVRLDLAPNTEVYPSASNTFITLRATKDHQPGNLFSKMTSIFEFLHKNVFLAGYSADGHDDFNSQGTDSETLTATIGRTIAKEACRLITQIYFTRVTPATVEELHNFSSIASAAISFENALINMGFLMDHDRQLSVFVNDIDIHFTNKKRDLLLSQGRAVMMKDDFATVSVKELDKQDELERQKAHGSDGSSTWSSISSDPEMADLKESSVSAKAKMLVDMVLNTLREAQDLSPEASPYLYKATRSLIDLYQALMPVYHAKTLTNVPALGILFYNDCMYLARELEKVPERMEDGIPGMEQVEYDDIIPQLKALGKKWLNIQVDKQKEELVASIEEANGFQETSVEDNFEACERAMKQVVLVFKHLGKVWKTTLSPLSFYTVLGRLLDYAVERVIREIEDLDDISEKESHQLALLCSLLFECEDLFDHAGPVVEAATAVVKGRGMGGSMTAAGIGDEDPIHFFVPQWAKYQQLTDILELSFAEIMTRFRAGQLRMFRVDELAHLVCALFADTPLRQRNLKEIEDGHPLGMMMMS